jgi:hypothetical protein
MSALPSFITFTGVDDNTDPADLVRLADDYPVEFGLLFSPKRQGIEPRYPKLQTIEWFVDELPLRWAAHMCGTAAAAVMQHGRTQYDAVMPSFGRAQINTNDPRALLDPSRLAWWALQHNMRAIVQCRGAFPLIFATDVLFDASGGRGIVPSDWPTAVRTTFCGYAGGLRPDNVAEAVAVIGRRADHYWIDMESGVRDADDRFSIARCREVCEAVYGAAVAPTKGVPS